MSDFEKNIPASGETAQRDRRRRSAGRRSTVRRNANFAALVKEAQTRNAESFSNRGEEALSRRNTSFATLVEEAQSRARQTDKEAILQPETVTAPVAKQPVLGAPNVSSITVPSNNELLTETSAVNAEETDLQDAPQSQTNVPAPPKSSSALHKRPAAKVVDDGFVPSYVAGVQIRDELAERKAVFNGWKDDPEAVEVVEKLGQGMRFDGADFSGVDFSGADLSGISFVGAVLSDANFAGADLRGADLSGADLRGVNLESANLEGANLEGALLDGAYLKNAIIVKVKLAAKALNELEKMQQLQLMAENGQVDLRKVNLKYLDLRRLDLRGVDLTGVDLSGVCLVGVNLSGCKVDPMYLDASYAFRSAPNRRLSIKKGSLAGADYTTATFIRAKEEERELLRQKRLEYDRLQEESDIAREQETQARFKQEEEQAALKVKEETLNFLAERRKETEVVQAQIEQAKQENAKERRIPVMKHRPRPKEELPPSKYDFPVLYPVNEEETPQKTSEVANVTQQVTYHVKKTIKKLMPRRSRVCKIRQRS